ncbi:glucose-6-phosphate dehydrogenase assembly protein OpcA [Spirochaeta cellobiosiphila]|uniref:glucose-6-phosphate dehydrogenase assembly protein OpcA n=1 Tax=Spirochaeta cellobiosiphila TaxID=504483 RepID=UPI0003FB9E75|nr:glucose-6-phosphate dehydrogenase assembly protein OpcA [Spirochaeta cellobiosiphila]
MNLIPNASFVEKELNKIQREQAPNDSRNSLFNIVIFSKHGTISRSEEALSSLLGKRPARIIHIYLGTPGKTRTEISAHCIEDFEHRGVCFQEVSIYSGTDKTGEDPGAWTPLLIRDIPTFLWWDDGFKHFPELLTQSENFADKLIIDSQMADLALLGEISGKIEEYNLCLTDISWQYLIPFIRLTARLFNPEDDLDNLYHIKSINLQGFSQSQVYLFLGWMGSKLNWTFLQNNENDIQVEVGNKKLILTWTKGSNKQIDFCTTTEYTYSIISDDKKELVNLIRGNKSSYQVSNPSISIGSIILQEVDKMYSDRIYNESLEWLKLNNNI